MVKSVVVLLMITNNEWLHERKAAVHQRVTHSRLIGTVFFARTKKMYYFLYKKKRKEKY